MHIITAQPTVSIPCSVNVTASLDAATVPRCYSTTTAVKVFYRPQSLQKSPKKLPAAAPPYAKTFLRPQSLQKSPQKVAGHAPVAQSRPEVRRRGGRASKVCKSRPKLIRSPPEERMCFQSRRKVVQSLQKSAEWSVGERDHVPDNRARSIAYMRRRGCPFSASVRRSGFKSTDVSISIINSRAARCVLNPDLQYLAIK